MQFDCGYLMIKKISITLLVAVAALLKFSVDKLINFYASDDVIYCLLSQLSEVLDS